MQPMIKSCRHDDDISVSVVLRDMVIALQHTAFHTMDITLSIMVIGCNRGLPCYVETWPELNTNRGRRPGKVFSRLRPEGHVFNIAWLAMV